MFDRHIMEMRLSPGGLVHRVSGSSEQWHLLQKTVGITLRVMDCDSSPQSGFMPVERGLETTPKRCVKCRPLRLHAGGTRV